MKQLLSILFITMSLLGYSQQDSLAKYTDQQIIDKMDQECDNPSEKIKFYADVLLRRNTSDSIKSVIYFDLANYYYDDYKKDHKKWLEINEKSLEYAKKSHNNYMISITFNAIVIGCFWDRNYKKIISCMKEMDIVTKEQEFDLDMVRTKCLLNVCYSTMGDFEHSIIEQKKLMRKIDDYLQKNPFLSKAEKKLINIEKITCHRDLIVDYLHTNQLDSAAKYLKQKKLLIKEYTPLNRDWDISDEIFYNILRNKYDVAIAILNIETDKKINNTERHIFLFQYQYALCYFAKKDYKKSLDYCEQALVKPLVLMSFEDYELELYKLAAKNAKALGNMAKYNLYTKKYAEGAAKTNYAEKAAFMAKLYEHNEVLPLKEELATKSSRAAMLFWGLGFACVLVGYLIFRIAKSRKEKKKFRAIIERLENKESIEIKPVEIEEPVFIDIEEEEEEISFKKNISSETETKILKKLENFERRQRFLEPNISLGTLALDFKTNTTYITYVIKKHKNENLINYINKLRIEYIIQKMASDPEYANYKIEYLAQESGFASYSTFKRIFTKETGIDPSKFINYLKKAN